MVSAVKCWRPAQTMQSVTEHVQPESETGNGAKAVDDILFGTSA